MSDRTRAARDPTPDGKAPYDAAKALDSESRAMIFDGVNMSQMVQMFRMDARTLARRLHSIKPVGRRGTSDIYAIHEVVPLLWRPSPQEIEEAVRRMNHQDLPKMLTKEYWAGQRSRQDYEFKRGDLWPTTKIIEHVGEIFKVFKMAVLLFSDAVERQTELTERQRQIIRQLSRGLLEDVDSIIKRTFKTPKPDSGSFNGSAMLLEDDNEEL